jgi:hypothetical protein
VIKKEMKETITFRPYLINPICQFVLYSCLFVALVYCWHTFENWIYLAIAILPLIGVFGFAKPLLFLQHVVIGKDKTITIRYWFGEGYTDKISKALYEIVLTKNNEIRSYRFKIQNKQFQVSPCVYERGGELESILKPFLKNKQISVKPAHLG